MRHLRAWLMRLLGLFDKGPRDSDFANELASHLQLHIEDNLGYGMTLDEARRQALIKSGGIESAKEKYRDRRGIPVLESILQDLRYTLRVLGRSPGFAAIALLTLALGIGANTAIFSLLNALVLRMLPVRQPERLVAISTLQPGGETGELSFPSFEEIERRQQSFSAIFAYSGGGVTNVEAANQLMRGDIWEVTGNFYSELGARPLLGRLLDSSDVALHEAAPVQVAVIGYGFWQRYYAGDTGVLGKTVRVDGVPFTVVGVMQKGFTAMSIESEPDVTIPLTSAPLIYGEDSNSIYTSPNHWLSVTGRLKDGASIEQARADIEVLWPGVLEATIPPNYKGDQRAAFLGQRVQVRSAARGEGTYLRSRFTGPVGALLGVSGLILLIACVNLASLALARAASRSHEMSVRAALGASRFRLSRQLLIESLSLSLVGAVAGVAMANWASLWLRDRIMQVFVVPPALNVTPDGVVLVFAAAMAIFTGTLFSVAPIWTARRQAPAGALQHGSRTIGAPIGRFGKVLITTQVALSVVLLVSAGLFVHSFAKLRSLDPGFRVENVLVAELFPLPGGYKNLDHASYYPELVSRLSNIPGVRSASMSHMRPLSNITGNSPVAAASSRPDEGGLNSDVQMVAPHFFETLGISLLAGRDFTWQDSGKAPPVAIVGQQVARRLFRSGDAIGQHIRIDDDRGGQSLEVVAVVADASLWNKRKQESLEVYVPLLQGYSEWSDLMLWTDGPPTALAESVSSEVQKLGHEYVVRTSSLARDADESIMEERLTATLSGCFGMLSLLLAAIGLYGLVSYAVTRRTREIGIRMALGATRGAVLWAVLRETVILVVSGIAIGIPCALLAARIIADLLFHLSPGDPVTLAMVAAVLLATGVLAAYLPARRASRSDPLVALRYE